MQTTNAVNELHDVLKGGTKTVNNPLSDNDNKEFDISEFTVYEDDLKDKVSFTYRTNIFNLSAIPSQIQTYSFNMMGKNIVIFEPSMLNGLPIQDIKNLIVFLFALAGFITVFRTI